MTLTIFYKILLVYLSLLGTGILTLYAYKIYRQLFLSIKPAVSKPTIAFRRIK